MEETTVLIHQASPIQNALGTHSGKSAIIGLQNKTLFETAHFIPVFELGNSADNLRRTYVIELTNYIGN